MGKKYHHWKPRSSDLPRNHDDLARLLLKNRDFAAIEKLEYGDHGLERAVSCVLSAIQKNQRIALYADYDVDGTMSCVSWVWFFKAIGFENYVTYIPCRFKEGYGVNLQAVRHLVETEKVNVLITMDTGITANEEAAYCKANGVEFVCTDHHKIQVDKMPDCITLNPKLHPSPLYQELCGCGVTFVLLRRLAETFPVSAETWTDLLALAGMATICDVVPLNPVNHRLARMGVSALMRSKRPILNRLREAASVQEKLDEQDVGFRLGPRINAVGRLGHADKVVEAFIHENPEALVAYMGQCNEERKEIQKRIVREATLLGADFPSEPLLFLGGDWHSGVVGIAASRIAEHFWKPTWLFGRKDGLGKGSARSIPGFDVTEAMQACAPLFLKFGGHRAAGGFSFELGKEEAIREALVAFAETSKAANPDQWVSSTQYDCELPLALADLQLGKTIDQWKPYGNSFEEPRFLVRGTISSVQFYEDKTTGSRKHTAVFLACPGQSARKILFFNEVLEHLESQSQLTCLVSAKKDSFRGKESLTLFGVDWNHPV
jgi:single-stranded-DNA-specific exonuclease